MKDSPLQIAKAKTAALASQVQRYKEENARLTSLLRKTQLDLEKQTKEMMDMQKASIEREKNREKQAIVTAKVEREKVHNLREELLTAQRDLTKQISLSKTQQIEHEKQLDRMRLQLEQQKDQSNTGYAWKSMERRNNDLERCKSELLLLGKKQMKLIEILKEQRNHERAAILLDIRDKTFLKEVKGVA